jgi:hypothetical protein
MGLSNGWQWLLGDRIKDYSAEDGLFDRGIGLKEE